MIDLKEMLWTSIMTQMEVLKESLKASVMSKWKENAYPGKSWHSNECVSGL